MAFTKRSPAATAAKWPLSRSEVAHGANVQTVKEDAEAALDIAVQCFRMLYDSRADLLAMDKSEQRANQLLLIDP